MAIFDPIHLDIFHCVRFYFFSFAFSVAVSRFDARAVRTYFYGNFFIWSFVFSHKIVELFELISHTSNYAHRVTVECMRNAPAALIDRFRNILNPFESGLLFESSGKCS